MPLRLYMDKDSVSRAVIRALREAGVQALTTTEAGNDEISDEDQLQFATDEGRALYTANVRDFTRLHTSWLDSGRPHAGIIVRYHQRTPIGQQVRALLRICDALPDGAADRLEVLEDWLREPAER